MIQVRSETFSNNFFTKPFEIGVRHLKVAFYGGSEAKLIELAKERIIHRPLAANNDRYPHLSLMGRVKHLTLGLINTLGYITLLPPLINLITNAYQSPYKKWKRIPGVSLSLETKTHLIEGGSVLGRRVDKEDERETSRRSAAFKEENCQRERRGEPRIYVCGMAFLPQWIEDRLDCTSDALDYYKKEGEKDLHPNRIGSLRRNPFAEDGYKDPFYEGASWIIRV